MSSGFRRTTTGLMDMAVHSLRRGASASRMVRRGPDLPDPDIHQDLLATIETEIVPRLAVAHRANPLVPASCADSRPPPTHDEIIDLADIAVAEDLDGAIAVVATMCREGLALETVLLELVSPAARLLGEQWSADLRPFFEVSAGVTTLHRLLHVFGPSLSSSGHAHHGRALLALAPGEQHSLGLFMVGEFLRRTSWDVLVDPTMSATDITGAVRTESFDVLGFSVSNDDALDSLPALVREVRRASINPDLFVIVGGPLDLTEFGARHGIAVSRGDALDAARYIQRYARVRHED